MRRSVGLPERDGVLVRGVVDDSPAARAGIREGDLLTKAGDRELRVPEDLFTVLADIEQGGQVTIELTRGTEDVTVTASF